jgi:hypothetical protein
LSSERSSGRSVWRKPGYVITLAVSWRQKPYDAAKHVTCCADVTETCCWFARVFLKKVADSLLSRTRTKVRYYKKGLPWYAFALRLIIDGLSQAGFRIEPYHVFLEELTVAPQVERGFDDYEVSFLEAADMREIAQIPGRRFTHGELLARLSEGQRCLGLRHQGRIAAFTWCDFTACLFENDRLFALRDNEACLFDAYTMEPFRGRDLAPFVRYSCYRELARIGRTRCFSVTVLFNVPAMRFKKKLNAKVIELWVLVELFRRWRFHRRLTRYVA